MVFRVYVEKRPGFDIEAGHLADELRSILGVHELERLRVINRYDVEGVERNLFERCVPTVFSEPPVDIVWSSLDEARTGTRIPADTHEPPCSVFAVEPLPGQFDQRADSASECIQLISQGERPNVLTAKVYLLYGALSADQISAIKRYVINPVEAREASLAERETLATAFPTPDSVERLTGFTSLDDAALERFRCERGLAMDADDLALCRDYFAKEQREPTITEIKVIDTYWSDHCRHTTFGTELAHVSIDDAMVARAFERYQRLRSALGREEKPLCLMDLATIGARQLKAAGKMRNVDESEEVNACTVKVSADVDGADEDWLFLFKNETHNHPTEIEPFGGAATCIGGCIRDPLSGRAYVYQAMRLTGAGDPLAPVEDTLPGKLPQRKIATTAAQGYSSYGNQIGLATGQVSELYHPGYVAKRMEVGAVVGAAPARNVRRERPAAGDVVILLGGRTGRDGIGGATGSSKAHSQESLDTCGAEVQKGNAPVERKIQRLFRRGEATRLIKRCNDFGAGGVSVAIGELANGLSINLDRIPKKYDGLDGTELALSESQERMAVDVAAADVEEFIGYAREENLEATPVAQVTSDDRVRMTWRGTVVVDIAREFLASNGAPKTASAHVERGGTWTPAWVREGSLEARMRAVLSNLNVCSNKGLAERFDSTVGASTVLAPFGGARQLTPSLAMAAKLPVDGETTTASGMAWGFNPYLSQANQYAGAYTAVVESVSKLVASGFERSRMYLTFQEYFGSLRDDPKRWGKPLASLLGALSAQLDLGVGAIGGKDSMSGSFETLDVPPTLVSFAVATGSIAQVTSPEFKGAGHRIALVSPRYECSPCNVCEPGAERANDPGNAIGASSSSVRGGAGAHTQAGPRLPQPESMRAVLDLVEHLIASGSALAVSTACFGGLAEALFKMAAGNAVGFDVRALDDTERLFDLAYGTFVVELSDDAELPCCTRDASAANGAAPLVHAEVIGCTTADHLMRACSLDGTEADEEIDLGALQKVWEAPLAPVYPYRTTAGAPTEERAFLGSECQRASNCKTPDAHGNGSETALGASISGAALPGGPRVAIPVFPGTNCEYDTARAFLRAGAAPETFVVNNLTPAAVAQSARAFARLVRQSQIITIPGGFSGGDEPDGAAKLIAAFFRAPEVADAVSDLLEMRDGLVLGICNGFQALVKLGLVPFGEIRPIDVNCPTLTFNTIGRHQSRIVRTRVASTLSPWLARCSVGDVYDVPISHGEGRFVAAPEVLQRMKDNCQIATQYADVAGNPSLALDANPNGSVLAIEGITSPDGRVLGKMGHSERWSVGVYKNLPALSRDPVIESGVDYFTC